LTRRCCAPAQIAPADADPGFHVSPSLEWLRGDLGGSRKVTLVPRGKLLFPEEDPRSMSVLLTQSWTNADA